MSKTVITVGSNQLRALISFAAVLATMLATLESIRAQDIESGRRLARAWCAECHRVEPGSFGIFAADFSEVANIPSTTALSLRVFLQSNHKQMPNFSLKPADADDIIAYILSLKRK